MRNIYDPNLIVNILLSILNQICTIHIIWKTYLQTQFIIEHNCIGLFNWVKYMGFAIFDFSLYNLALQLWRKGP